MKLETWASISSTAVLVGFALVALSYLTSFWMLGQRPSDQKAEALGQARARLHQLSSGPLPDQSDERYAEELLKAQEVFRDEMESIERSQARGQAVTRVIWWIGAVLAAVGFIGYLAARAD